MPNKKKKKIVAVAIASTLFTGAFGAVVTQDQWCDSLPIVQILSQESILTDTLVLSGDDRMDFKAQKIAETNLCGTYEDETYGVKVEVKSIQDIGDGRIEIYARAWKNGAQIGFGDGSVDIERFIIANPPIMVWDGTTRTAVVEGIEKEVRNFKEDKIEATKQVLAYTISATGRGGADIVPGKVGHSTLTSQPAAGVGGTSVDGNVTRGGVDEVWGTIRAGAGTAHSDTDTEQSVVRTQASATSNQYQNLIRYISTFPGIGTIGAGDVTAATYSIWVTDTTSYVGLSGGASANSAGVLVAATPASTNDLVDADYNQLGATDFGRTAAQGSLTAGAYNDITCNASCQTTIETAATGSGVVSFGLRLGWDFDNTTTGITWANAGLQGWLGYGADQAGTANDIKLVITYTGSRNRLF